MKTSKSLLLSAFLAAACSGRPSAAPETGLPFPQVAVPGVLTDPEERLSWICLHFWDALTDTTRTGRSDSLFVSGVDKETVEEQFGLFATLLGNADPQTADRAMVRLYERAAACEAHDSTSNVFETAVEFAGKYFYDPNSPVRSEEIYLPFVEKLAESPHVRPGMRQAYAYDASLCRLNRPGTVAPDFLFRDLQGRAHTLYGTRTPFTLLLFTNPGCEVCLSVIEMLEESSVLDRLIADGTLSVVNVYIDPDIDAWKEYAVRYPKTWLSGYDPDGVIRSDLLYAVRAIPSLYLLDGSKTVLLKDAQPEQMMAAIETI